MHLLVLLSDQFSTWSANGRYSVVHFAQTPGAIAEANAGVRDALARLSHRALQALRQTGLQVCRRPRPWPQVLPIRELPGRRPQMDYVPQADYTNVAEHLANYHRVREIIEEICEINRELLRRRETL